MPENNRCDWCLAPCTNCSVEPKPLPEEPEIISRWRATGFWPQVIEYIDRLKAHALGR